MFCEDKVTQKRQGKHHHPEHEREPATIFNFAEIRGKGRHAPAAVIDQPQRGGDIKRAQQRALPGGHQRGARTARFSGAYSKALLTLAGKVRLQEGREPRREIGTCVPPTVQARSRRHNPPQPAENIEHGIPPQEFERRQWFERSEHLGKSLLLLDPRVLFHVAPAVAEAAIS